MNQTLKPETKLLGNGRGDGKGPEPRLLVARGRTYDAEAAKASEALERLNKLSPSKPGSEMLVVGHGV